MTDLRLELGDRLWLELGDRLWLELEDRLWLELGRQTRPSGHSLSSFFAEVDRSIIDVRFIQNKNHQSFH